MNNKKDANEPIKTANKHLRGAENDALQFLLPGEHLQQQHKVPKTGHAAAPQEKPHTSQPVVAQVGLHPTARAEARTGDLHHRHEDVLAGLNKKISLEFSKKREKCQRY